MTVASNPPYDQYTATGGQTVFNYTFEIVENTDLLVYQTPQGDAPNDLLQLLTFNVDYTVTGVGAENGGTVVLNTGAALGDIITIKQNVPVQRDTAFTPGGVLRANDLNSEFDNQTLIQQLTRFNEQQRMLRYWDSAIVVPYVDTILPVLGANQIWAKNPNNDEIIPYDVPPGGGLAPDQGTYIVQTPNGSLPNAVALYAYGSGFMANTAAIGFTATRVLVPTLNQINISNPAGLLGNPIFSIAPNVILPGTAGMGIPAGTTAQRVTPTGSSIGMRFNTDLEIIEAYIGGVWVEIPSSAAGLFLPLAGGIMAGNIDMDSNIIFGLPLPTNNDDAANKQYVDNAVGGAAGGLTGNMQWNNGGAFAGDPNFNTDGLGNIEIDGSLRTDNILIDGNRISATTGLVELEDAQLFNPLDANSNKIENLAICTVGTDAANKNYVDATAAGRYFVAPVRASATGNFAATYNNGSSGVGATLTASVNGAAAQDGVTLALNDRVVFPFQSSSFQNGIYTVTDLGSVGTPAVYTRATDYDQPTEIDPGDTVGVTEGTLYAGAFWMETAIVATIGTDPINFILSVNPNVVTLNTAQTITGVKTFDANVIISNSSTLQINGTTAIDSVLDEDTMSSNSATAVPTQQSTKAYIDSFVGGGHIAKNLIIGGNFDTNPWQRGTTFAATGGGAFNADRFSMTGTNTASCTVQRTADAPSVSQCGMLVNNCLEMVVNTAQASIGSTDSYQMQQKIEGYNAAQILQQPFTLSFWVKSNNPGTYCVFLSNSTPDRSYVADYTINSANTWEKKTITVSASPSAGAWNYTSGIGLRVGFSFAAGSSLQTTGNSWQAGAFFATSNQANGLGTINNYFRFALIQVESGNIATPFEIRTAQQEIILCQRYCFKTFPIGTTPAQNTTISNGVVFYRVSSSGAVSGGANLQYPVLMRAAPSATFYSTNAASAQWYNISAGAPSGNASAVGASDRGIYINNSQVAGDSPPQGIQIHGLFTAEI